MALSALQKPTHLEFNNTTRHASAFWSQQGFNGVYLALSLVSRLSAEPTNLDDARSEMIDCAVAGWNSGLPEAAVDLICFVL